jgi:hypothetical protein
MEVARHWDTLTSNTHGGAYLTITAFRRSLAKWKESQSEISSGVQSQKAVDKRPKTDASQQLGASRTGGNASESRSTQTGTHKHDDWQPKESLGIDAQSDGHGIAKSLSVSGISSPLNAHNVVCANDSPDDDVPQTQGAISDLAARGVLLRENVLLESATFGAVDCSPTPIISNTDFGKPVEQDVIAACVTYDSTNELREPLTSTDSWEILVQDQLSDEAWLKSISLRSELKDTFEFDRAAILWRHAEPLLTQLVKLINPSAEEVNNSVLPKLSRHNLSLRVLYSACIKPPWEWQLCPSCDSRVGGAACERPCQSCHGQGFQPTHPGKIDLSNLKK